MSYSSEDMLSWIESQKMDRTAGYLTRGRKHGAMPPDQLRAQWVSSFRHMARNPNNAEARTAHNDFDSEMSCRNEAPPFELIQDDFEVLKAQLNQAVADGDIDEEALEMDVKSFRAARGSNG